MTSRCAGYRQKTEAEYQRGIHTSRLTRRASGTLYVPEDLLLSLPTTISLLTPRYDDIITILVRAPIESRIHAFFDGRPPPFPRPLAPTLFPPSCTTRRQSFPPVHPLDSYIRHSVFRYPACTSYSIFPASSPPLPPTYSPPPSSSSASSTARPVPGPAPPQIPHSTRPISYYICRYPTTMI